MTDKDIIEALGGHRALAAAVGKDANSVKQWKLGKRGIPWRQRSKIAKLAKAKRIKLPANFIEERAP